MITPNNSYRTFYRNHRHPDRSILAKAYRHRLTSLLLLAVFVGLLLSFGAVLAFGLPLQGVSQTIPLNAGTTLDWAFAGGVPVNHTRTIHSLRVTRSACHPDDIMEIRVQRFNVFYRVMTVQGCPTNGPNVINGAIYVIGNRMLSTDPTTGKSTLYGEGPELRLQEGETVRAWIQRSGQGQNGFLQYEIVWSDQPVTP